MAERDGIGGVGGVGGLRRMSTTAGLGDDYQAPDPLAIAAVALAVVSFVVLLLPWAFALPAAGVAAAAAALVRIGRAGGTLTGRPMAWIGGAVCLALLVSAAVTLVGGALRQDRDAAAIAAVVADLGAALAGDDYAAAYEAFHPGFRAGVDPETFARTWENFQAARGDVGGVRTSGRYQVQRSPGDGTPDLAATQLLFELEGREAPFRARRAVFFGGPDGWRLRTLAEIFPQAGGAEE